VKSVVIGPVHAVTSIQLLRHYRVVAWSVADVTPGWEKHQGIKPLSYSDCTVPGMSVDCWGTSSHWM